jgi:hypothetical protein
MEGIFVSMKKLGSLFLCLMLAQATFAQKPEHSNEIGIFIGCAYYIGDLNPTGHFGPLTQPAVGGIFRHNFNTRFAVKANVYVGNIEGDDARTSSASQQDRNLSFKSYIRELGAQAEFNFLEYKTGSSKHPYTPYLFGGIAVFMFDPMAQVGNNWIDLQSIGTEGQGTKLGGKKYKLTQISLPFGAGLKLSMAKRICLSLEWGMRKTFTPYLDDVSGNYADAAVLAQNGPYAVILGDRSISKDPAKSRVGSERGNGGKSDWYSFAGVILSFQLKNKEKHCYSYN